MLGRGIPMAHEQGSRKAIFYALAANLGIAAAKTAAAIITRSGSMLAEAIHSFADCGNQGLLFVGLASARKPATPQHPLGFGKAVYFWSFIVALMLFSMGGLFSIYEGIHKISDPRGLKDPWVALGVLLVSIILEILSFRGAMREVNKLRKGKSLWSWFKSTRHSELMVVIGEDLAAILGLCLAATAVFLTMVSGNPLFDALGSVGIGTLLIVVALGIGVEVKSLLIGESVEEDLQEEITTLLSQQKEVEHLFHLITLQMGSDVMVAVKARMSPAPSATALIEAINRCEATLRQTYPQIKWIFFEPDVTD